MANGIVLYCRSNRQRRTSLRKGLVINYIYFACLNGSNSYFYTVKEPRGLNCLAMRKPCCQNESDLLFKISKGDEDAFNKVVDTYTPMIYATALAYIKIVESAEDTTQEVFYKVWKNREKLTEVESLKDYLFIITRNEVLSSLRKKGPSYPLGEYLDGTLKEKNWCPGDTLSLRQLQQTLQRAVTMLPPQQKQAYLLSREEGLQHNEIAQKMNLSRNTVKNHIIAALNFIRQYVQDNADVVFFLIAFLMIF